MDHKNAFSININNNEEETPGNDRKLYYTNYKQNESPRSDMTNHGHNQIKKLIQTHLVKKWKV